MFSLNFMGQHRLWTHNLPYIPDAIHISTGADYTTLNTSTTVTDAISRVAMGCGLTYVPSNLKFVEIVDC